jgi:hypothetical protein
LVLTAINRLLIFSQFEVTLIFIDLRSDFVGKVLSQLVGELEFELLLIDAVTIVIGVFFLDLCINIHVVQYQNKLGKFLQVFLRKVWLTDGECHQYLIECVDNRGINPATSAVHDGANYSVESISRKLELISHKLSDKLNPQRGLSDSCARVLKSTGVNQSHAFKLMELSFKCHGFH